MAGPLAAQIVRLTCTYDRRCQDCQRFGLLWMVSRIPGLRPKGTVPGPLVAADRTSSRTVTIHSLGAKL